jgi:hypothetical protein
MIRCETGSNEHVDDIFGDGGRNCITMCSKTLKIGGYGFSGIRECFLPRATLRC